MKVSTVVAFTTLLFLILVGVWQKECKAETVFLLDQYSYHWKPKDYYNDHHELVGVEQDGYGIINFLNSDYQHTTAVYKRTELASQGPWGIGWKGMLIYGYDDISLPILPMIFLDLRVYYKNMGLELNCIPGLLTSAGVLIKF